MLLVHLAERESAVGAPGFDHAAAVERRSASISFRERLPAQHVERGQPEFRPGMRPGWQNFSTAQKVNTLSFGPSI